MPRPNNNSYKGNNSSSDSGSVRRLGGNKPQGGQRKFKQNDFNMLTFGQGFGDYVTTAGGKEALRVRIMLKNTDVVLDEAKDEYTHEQAVQLLAEALLSERGIVCYLFEDDKKNDGSLGGNARIDIKGIEVPDADEDDEADEEEEEEPAPAPVVKTVAKKKAKVTPAKKVTKVVYEVPQIEEDDDDEITIESADEAFPVKPILSFDDLEDPLSTTDNPDLLEKLLPF